jgi:alpha-galactosidase
MLAKTPPMGWNSWNTFGPNINEQIILETADALVEKGYLDAGYEYLVIDDAWMTKERENGKLVVDTEKFPHGMKYVGDYIHSKGLKFGIYSAAGTLTCQGFPGSYGHEYEDAQMFAEWGVDYLKYDLCHYPGSGDVKNSYLTMSMALKATGRDIMYAGCTVGEREPHTWMRSIGAHLYRSTGDITDNLQSIRSNAMSQLRKLYSSAPGCFNDIDMLVVGMSGKGHVSHTGGCTDNEYLLHFAMWCLWGAPLMIGGDVRTMNEECRKILLNRDLIRIDQDEECRPPYYEERQRYAADGRLGFMKLLSDNEIVLGYFNFSETEDLMTPFYFDDYGIPAYTGYGFDITDIITGEHIGVKHDSFCPVVPMQGFKLYKAKLVK